MAQQAKVLGAQPDNWNTPQKILEGKNWLLQVVFCLLHIWPVMQTHTHKNKFLVVLFWVLFAFWFYFFLFFFFFFLIWLRVSCRILSSALISLRADFSPLPFFKLFLKSRGPEFRSISCAHVRITEYTLRTHN